jgi:transcriptional regulator of PTS gene
MRMNEKEANRLHVLKMIRRHEPVARTDLTRITGLAQATITAIVGDFVRLGYLAEEKAPLATGGRPRIALRLNPDAAYVVGALLAEDGTMLVEVANLRGDTLNRHVSPIAWRQTLDAYVAQMADIVRDGIARSAVDPAAIHSIGLALPALIDSESGIVNWFPAFPPDPIPLAAILQERLGLPVRIEHAADVIARAEHWFGDDLQMQDFSLLMLDLGMGFSRYVDGQVRAGAHGLNSELAHVKMVLDDGPACVCGARGCLTAFASVIGIVTRIAAIRGEARPRIKAVRGLFRDYARAALAGDGDARAIFDQGGRCLGLAVANHINVSDPARVMILVREPLLRELIAPAFDAALAANVLPPFAERVPVAFRAWTDAHSSRGAAALVLERLYRASGG